MDILKRIDHALSFCTIYSDNSCSTEVDKWRHHVTPHLLNDVRQYIESLQLKLMHEQTKQAQRQDKPLAWCELSIDGNHIAYFDGKPMIMCGPNGNVCHTTPLYKTTAMKDQE